MMSSRQVRFPTLALALSVFAATWLWAQSGGRNAITVVTPEGRQAVAIRIVDGREMVALDDLAAIFRLDVREDPLAGGLTLSRQGRTLVMSSQGLVSSGGRLVSLQPPVREGRAWLVPLDFVARGLPLVLDVRAEYRRAARMLIAGDLTLPRIVVRTASQAGTERVTIDISPRTEHAVVQEPGRLLLRFTADALDTDIAPHAAGDLLTAVRAIESPPAIALDLGPRFASFRASDIPVDASSTRVVIDLLGAGGSATPAAPAAPAAADAPPLPVFEGPVTGVRTIVLDPGHGGDEQGAHGPAGTIEDRKSVV